jgi:DNA/RNA endonuclease YhcR with UshA esterase domain
MCNKFVFCIFVGIVALCAAISLDAADRRDRDVDSYDVRSERILEGSVAGKRYIIGGVVYFPLNAGGMVVEVQLGPKNFVERSTFTLKAGEMVIVVGVRAVVNKRDVVLARQISSMNGTLILRDDDGARLGTPIRSERIR